VAGLHPTVVVPNMVWRTGQIAGSKDLVPLEACLGWIGATSGAHAIVVHARSTCALGKSSTEFG